MSQMTPPMPPSPSNPLGSLLATPLEIALRKLVDERIEDAWRGRNAPDFNGTPDALLCMELIARGWVVYKPQHLEDRQR